MAVHSKVLELQQKRHDLHSASDEPAGQLRANSEKSATVNVIGKGSAMSLIYSGA